MVLKNDPTTFPAFVESLMRSVASLRFHDVPDYDHFREIFSAPELSSASRATSSNDDDDEVILSLKMEPSRVVKSGSRSSAGRRAARSKRFRVKRKAATSKLKQFPAASSSSSSPSGPESVSDYQALRSRRDRQVCVESLKNPTPAMLQQMEKMKSRPTSEVVADVDGGKKEG